MATASASTSSPTPYSSTDDINTHHSPPSSSSSPDSNTELSWQSIGLWHSPYQGYTESLAEAEQVFQEYEIATGSKFIVSYKRINFGRTFKGKTILGYL